VEEPINGPLWTDSRGRRLTAFSEWFLRPLFLLLPLLRGESHTQGAEQVGELGSTSSPPALQNP
jgi:hypothetical protein